MVGVNQADPGFSTIVETSVAMVLNTTPACVDVEKVFDQRRLLSARRLATGSSGKAGVGQTTDEAVKNALKSDQLKKSICSQVGTTGCAVEGDGFLFTTTTEMPWGIPWWAWLLICCALMALCGLCLSPLLAAPMMGGKKKSKSPAYDQNIEYEVVDVPNDEVPMATNMPGYGGPSYGSQYGGYGGQPYQTYY